MGFLGVVSGVILRSVSGQGCDPAAARRTLTWIQRALRRYNDAVRAAYNEADEILSELEAIVRQGRVSAESRRVQLLSDSLTTSLQGLKTMINDPQNRR